MLPRLDIPEPLRPEAEAPWEEEDTPREPRDPRPAGSLPSSPSARKTKSRAARSWVRTNSLRDARVLVVSDLHRTESAMDPSLFQYHQHFESPWQLVGKTSLSEVFRVRHRATCEVFAVKRSRRRFRSKLQRERCLREIRAVAALPTHPNIVNQYRAWQEGGHFYIQMDFCEGGTLGQRAQQAFVQGHRMTDEQLWSTACQAAQGLAFLHSHGVMHLDIKPDNIYLSAAGSGSSIGGGSSPAPGAAVGWATCRIGDFGLAVAREQDGRMDWEEGDGDYVAPELLAAGGEPLPAADIFSLGATLFECATGRRLPRSEGWAAADVAALQVEGRPASFVQLLRAMLQPSPALRPTAQQVVDTIAREQPAVAAEVQAAVDAAAAVARAEEAAAEAALAARQAAAAAGQQQEQQQAVQQSPEALAEEERSLQRSPFMQAACPRSSGDGAAFAGAAHAGASPLAAADPMAASPAAAAAEQFSFDVPQQCPPSGGFAFTPGQPLRAHNRRSGGFGGGPPGTAMKSRGTPGGRTRIGARWAPALSPLISEGALTPGAAAALAGLTPAPRFGRRGSDAGDAPTPQLLQLHGEEANSGSGGSQGHAGATPLDMWRPAPLQVPPATAAPPSGGILSSGSGQHGSGGTHDSRDGWRISRRDVLSPDSDFFNGSHSESEYSYSCGTGRTTSDMDFADALSPMSAELGFFGSGRTPSTGTPESLRRDSCTPGSSGPHRQQQPTPQQPTPHQQRLAQQQQQQGGMAAPSPELPPVAGRLLQAAPSSLAWDLHTSPEFLMQLPPGSPASLSRSSSLDDAASLPSSRALSMRRFPTLDSWGSQLDGACNKQGPLGRIDSLPALTAAAQRFTNTFTQPQRQQQGRGDVVADCSAAAAAQQAAAGATGAALAVAQPAPVADSQLCGSDAVAADATAAVPVPAGRALRKRQHSSRRTLMAALSRDNSVASSIDGMAPLGKSRHISDSSCTSPTAAAAEPGDLAPLHLHNHSPPGMPHRSSSLLGREAAAALADAAVKALGDHTQAPSAAGAAAVAPADDLCVAATPSHLLQRDGFGPAAAQGRMTAPPSPLHARMTGLKLRNAD